MESDVLSSDDNEETDFEYVECDEYDEYDDFLEYETEKKEYDLESDTLRSVSNMFRSIRTELDIVKKNPAIYSDKISDEYDNIIREYDYVIKNNIILTTVANQLKTDIMNCIVTHNKIIDLEKLKEDHMKKSTQSMRRDRILLKSMCSSRENFIEQSPISITESEEIIIEEPSLNTSKNTSKPTFEKVETISSPKRNLVPQINSNPIYTESNLQPVELSKMYQRAFDYLSLILRQIKAMTIMPGRFTIDDIQDGFNACIETYEHIIIQHNNLIDMVDQIHHGIKTIPKVDMTNPYGPNHAILETDSIFTDYYKILKIIQDKVSFFVSNPDTFTDELYDHYLGILSIHDNVICRYPTLQQLAKQIRFSLDKCKSQKINFHPSGENKLISFNVDDSYRTVCTKLIAIKKRLDDFSPTDTIDEIFGDFCDIQDKHSDTIDKHAYFKELVGKITCGINLYF